MDSLFFHPKVVHIPIALGVLMPMLAGGFLLAWWREWLPPRGWVIVVGLQAVLLGSGIVALQTGESAEERVEDIVPERAIEEHEEAAEAFVWASGAVLGVMLVALATARRREGLPLAALATVGTLVALVLSYQTGQAGGALVYQHGAASAYVSPARQVPAAPRIEGRDDDD